jgi:hypothetical protein
MTGEELVGYFQTYGDHLEECDKHISRALRIWIHNGHVTPQCTCGLDDLFAEIGLPPTPDVFEDGATLGYIDETELESLLDLPPGLRRRDKCPQCRTTNPVEFFEKADEGIVARYQCICGNSHAIVHSGPAVKNYDKWLEAKEAAKKKEEAETPKPEN